VYNINILFIKGVFIFMGEYMGEKFKEYAFNTKYIGLVRNASIKYQFTSKKCGDTFKIYIKLDESKKRVIDAKYKIFGCMALMAGSRVTCELIIGKTIDEIMNIKDKDVLSYFDEYPEDRLDCILRMKNCLIDEVFVNFA
jgi:NifU-like protein involved in Fe-S cluster formation